MYNNKKVSVILPTYNEKDSIRKVIQDFYIINVVDEVIVINNKASAGTSEEVAKTNAREVLESKQGYGHAIRRGFLEATGDYIVVCEPDDTFMAKDIFKLLAYANDCDVVYGTRTVSIFVWSGANMGRFLRYGNWAVAKLIEFLFNTISLSDVGCTMRLITKPALKKINGHFSVGGEHFGPEMMLLSIIHKLKIVQIPVNYKKRVGISSVTGNLYKTIKLGIIMILFILKCRVLTLFRFSRKK